MDTGTWVTVVAHDTPFLAQLATERLDEMGIEHRTLSDSAGGNLPHISFGSGGYRVQVPSELEEAARGALVALPDDALDHIDVGEFEDGDDGVQPGRGRDDRALAGTGSRRSWVQVGAVLTAVVVGFLYLLVGTTLGWPVPFGV